VEKVEKITKICEKTSPFLLRIYQKTSNNSRSFFNVKKVFIRINAEIEKLSGNMLLVAEHLV
jgi:hypothetical protein